MPKSPKTASAKSSRPSKSHKSPKTSKTSKKKEENNDPLSTEERENLLNVHCEFPDYLSQCKNKRVKTPATVTNKLKAKYYDFHDNYRPAYYGTWRRRSKAINGRRPFSKGEKFILLKNFPSKSASIVSAFSQSLGDMIYLKLQSLYDNTFL
uniref:Chromatin assembly factor 1 subunit A dimerization domain-containing protein n=1 Tax=Meloidogyne javanica TaxID=6303 RepID=A0A915N7B0_MELJA